MAGNDPFVGSNDISASWFSWDLCGTEYCRILLNRHDVFSLRDGELSESLVCEIKKVFSNNGVPLGESPLIPISKVIRNQ